VLEPCADEVATLPGADVAAVYFVSVAAIVIVSFDASGVSVMLLPCITVTVSVLASAATVVVYFLL